MSKADANSPTPSLTPTLVGMPTDSDDRPTRPTTSEPAALSAGEQEVAKAELERLEGHGEAKTAPIDDRQPLKRAPTRVTIQSDPKSQPPRTALAQQQPLDSPSSPSPIPPNDFTPLNRSTTGASSSKAYSTFSTPTKWLIVGLGGIAAMLSPISSNIFVPAIPTLVIDFKSTSEHISLAVTIYLIFQAITPSFFGSMSDSFGRRPIYLATLIVYLGANIGLALMPTSAYWLLLVLRALQATGGSAVISIGAGAVSDVAEPRERGTFMSVFQAGAMIGPAFGPLLGGVFASTLGWRAIFWFLVIATGVILVPLIFFFPETLRSLVGDGSIPPPGLNASPMVLWQRRKARRDPDHEAEEKVDRPAKKPYQPLSAFWILFTPEILLLFIFTSLLYLEFYCVLTVYSTALLDTYHLTELQIGLCYLPSGLGSICSSLLNGRQLDYYYRKEEARVGGDYRKKPDEFRIHLTRIRCLVPFMCCFLFACTALGWCLESHAPLAATLVVNFFVGLGTGTIGTATVYGQDIKPGQGGAVSASLNLVRCLFGAAGTGVIQIIYSAIGAGWTFVLLSGIVVVGIPLPLLVLKHADGWRLRREAKARAKAEAAMGEKGPQ